MAILSRHCWIQRSTGNISVYVDASPGCNQLIFQLGTTAMGTPSVNPSWVIKASIISCQVARLWIWLQKFPQSHKVTQYNCDYTNKAPPGCNQYFTGSSGEVMSFNYQDGNSNGLHLASQDQTICVRLLYYVLHAECWLTSESTKVSKILTERVRLRNTVCEIATN